MPGNEGRSNEATQGQCLNKRRAYLKKGNKNLEVNHVNVSSQLFKIAGLAERGN